MSQMGKVAKRSERSVNNIRKNMRLFGDAWSHPVPVGRQPSIAPVMLDALCDHLVEKPGLYIEEMAIFSCVEFNMLLSLPSIKPAFSQSDWTKKTNRKQKNTTLNCEISTSINYLSFGRIIWYFSINLDAIKGWIISGLAGHHSA
jgi:hypothetical protein